MTGTVLSALVILLMGCLFCNCHTVRPDPEEEALKEIEELHVKDMEAAKVHDMDTLIELWTDDGVLLQPGQEPLIGKDAIWEYMVEAGKEMEQIEITEYVQDFLEVKVLGDYAYEWGTFRGKSRPLSGGKETRQRSRLFRVLKRQADGSWKCARAIWHELPSDG